MNVMIIGSGQVGSALRQALARAGHAVDFAEREVRDPRVAAADAVILATPYEVAVSALKLHAPYSNTIVIDATNPLSRGPKGLQLMDAPAGAVAIAAAVPGIRLYKAFNQTGFETMADARRYAAPVMFAAGDDSEGKAKVMQLITDAGFVAADAGPLANARLIESLAMLWIDQAYVRGRGRDFAFCMSTPGETS